MIENFWLNAAYSVTPTILIGLVFWFVMRSILRADRNERDYKARMERELRGRERRERPNSNISFRPASRK